MMTAVCCCAPVVAPDAELQGGLFQEDGLPESEVPKPALEPAFDSEIKLELKPETKPELTPAPEGSLSKKVQLRLPISLREKETDYDYDDFQISFTKIAGASLGVVAWKGPGSLCVLAVVRGGPIERWNKRNELTVVKSGAIIYEVRSERGDCACTGEAMARLAKAAQQVTIKARYYKKKKVCIEKANCCILGIRLFQGTTIIESIDEEGPVGKRNDLNDERNLILPGDRITHINGEDCDGDNVSQMLRDVTGKMILTIRNAGCVLDL